MDLPTYTNIWRIEKRLYKLYDFRLPIPLPMIQIGVFVGVTVPWFLLLQLAGVPFRTPWHVVYLVPPGVITWLATRPVIEGKRLTELIFSQVRYLLEPRTWCRLTPVQEPGEVVIVGRVWRRAPSTGRQRRRAAARPADARRPIVRPAPAGVPAAGAARTVGAPAAGGVPTAPARREVPPLVTGRHDVPARAASITPLDRPRRVPAPAAADAVPRSVTSARPLAAREQAAARAERSVPARPDTTARPTQLAPAGEPPAVPGTPAAHPSVAPATASSPPTVPAMSAASPPPTSAPPARAPRPQSPPPAPSSPWRVASGGRPPAPESWLRGRPSPGARPRHSGEPGFPRVMPPVDGLTSSGTTPPVPTASPSSARPPTAPSPHPATATSGATVPADPAPPQPDGTSGAAVTPVSQPSPDPSAHTPSASRPFHAPGPAQRDPAPPEALRPGRAPGPFAASDAERGVAAPPRRSTSQRATDPNTGATPHRAPTEPSAEPSRAAPPAAPSSAPPAEPRAARPAPVEATPADPAAPVDAVSVAEPVVRPVPSRRADGPTSVTVPSFEGNRSSDGLADPVARPVEQVLRRGPGSGWRRFARIVSGSNGAGKVGASDLERVRTPFRGSRRVVVLGCTGGAGQTLTALMLGHTLAAHRDDRIVAIDANPGGGSLARRAGVETPETMTSLLACSDRVADYLAMRTYTSRSRSGLEVVAPDEDPAVMQALDDRDYARVVELLDRHYKIALIDPAAAGVARLLRHADQLVLVAPASADAARAVAMTFEWLHGHGHADLRTHAVLVINGVSRRSLRDVEQAESLARGRCRAMVRVPWDDRLTSERETPVVDGLRPPAQQAYLALAGVIAAGLVTVPDRYREGVSP